MENNFTEEFPLDRFVNIQTLDEVLYKFENERKLEDISKTKTQYTYDEFIKEFPKAKEEELKQDISGNVSSER
jgi:hypothetical protein